MSTDIETASRGRQKLRRRLLPVLIAGCFGTAAANPLGPQVINGQAGFSTQGNVLSVTNTPGAIINWQSFSINPGELTRFIQQNPGSAVLNRIVGQDPSQILGALQSNGRVFLVNPNGIVFGQGAQVDVNGLVASTLNIGNDDFIKGKWNFQAGDKAGDLKNQGAITTPAGGQVYLIAPNVENSGIITSPKGEVMLAAGHTVQLVDSLDPNLQVVLSAPEHEALNLGKVIAQGGKTGIFGALIKQRGIVNADSAVVGENGKIVFKATRDTLLEAGSVTSARGAGKGGEVIVQGGRVGLMGDALVDASGNTGGGTVLVGGDYQGRNTQIRNAVVSHVSDGATIKADAIENGDGGKVVVWSDDTTRVYGQISARGGSRSGNGGFVETSGHRYLEVDKAPDVSAPKGQGGNWLLDPEDITISSAASSNVKPAGLPNTFQPDTAGSGSTVNAGAIKTAIAAGSTVTIDTSVAGGTGSGNIVVDSSATDLGGLNAGSGAKLILNADNDITINTSIINAGNPLDLNFKANAYGGATTGNVLLGANVLLKPKGGAVTISSKGGVALAAGAVIGGDMAYDYGNFSVTSSAGGISLLSSAIATNGTVTLKAGGSGGIVTSGTGAGSGGLFVQGANVALDSAGPITIDKLDGTVVARSTGAGSAITLTDAGALVIGGSPVSSVPAGVTTANGNISLNATAGMLIVDGNVNAGTGNVQLSMDKTTAYGVVADADITGGSVYVTSGTLGISGSGTIAASNLYLQPSGGTGPIGASNAPLNTASPGGTGNTNISIGYSAGSSGPSEVYIDHTGNATLTQVTLKPATATPFNMMASGSITASTGIATNGGNLRLVAHDDLTIGSGANLSTAGGNIDLASNYGNIKIDGGVSSTGAGFPGYIDVEADGNVTIKGSVSANGSPDGGSVYIGSYNGNVAFSGASAAVSAIGAGGEVLIDAPYGAITADDSSHVVIAAPNLIFDAGNGIHGPTSADYLMTNVSKLDVTNFGGSVRLKNASGAGLTLANLHTETESYAVRHWSTGDFQISDSTSLTVSDSIDAGAGTLMLEGPAITVAKDVNAHGIQFFTDSLAISTGIVTASGAPTPTSFGGISFSPVTSDKPIKIGTASSGGELLVNAAKLKTMSDTPVPGDMVSDAFSFHTMDTMQINVASALNLPTATLYMKSGTVNINAPVTARSATYIANSFTAAAATTVDTAYGSINIGPYNPARDILIAPSVAGSDPTAGSKLWIDSAALADKFVGNSLAFGIHDNSAEAMGAANTGNITISAPITGTAATFKSLQLISKGIVTQSTASDSISLPGSVGFIGGATSGGTFLLDIADNSVDHIWGLGNTIKFKNNMSLAAYDIESTGGPISLTAAGDFSGYGISSKGGDISIKTTGAGHNINISPPGIDACYTTTPCTSTVSLNAAGSVTIPLVKAGSAVDIKAGGDVIDGDGSANNIVSGSGSPISLTYTVGGNISLDAWGASASGTVAGTKNIRLAMPTSTSGGSGTSSGGPTTPTLDQCTANPTQAGCSTVLPKLDTCITNPTQAGCSAVLPPMTSCVSNPTQAGCSAVLPNISQCTTNPSQTGCSAVLPPFDTCVSNPTQAGCSAVLPPMSTCVSNPTQAGCSAVLPPISSCVSNPTQAGCSVVLPPLNSCVSNPTQAGCSAVLPPLNSCVSNPTQAGCSAVLPPMSSCVSNPAQVGCSAVLPPFDSCVSNPTQAGCSAVLPPLSTCTSTPGTAGCSAVLPTLSQCSANPTQAGCSAVLPIASKCTINPKAEGCETVLPSTGLNSGAKETVTETVTSTVNTVVKASTQASVSRVESGGGSSSGSASSSSNQADKSDEKKDDKKTTIGAEDSGAKKNEKPTTKMYCN